VLSKLLDVACVVGEKGEGGGDRVNKPLLLSLSPLSTPTTQASWMK